MLLPVKPSEANVSLVILPVGVDCVRKLEDLQSISLSFRDPPAFSKFVQIPDHCPVRLHVLISGDAVVVSTQSSNRVPIGAGQYDLCHTNREAEEGRE